MEFAYVVRCETSIDAEYVLGDQQKPHIEHFVRQSDNQWLLSETNDLGAVLPLPTLQSHLPLAEIYRKVVFREQSGNDFAETISDGE